MFFFFQRHQPWPLKAMTKVLETMLAMLPVRMPKTNHPAPQRIPKMKPARFSLARQRVDAKPKIIPIQSAPWYLNKLSITKP